MKLILRRLPLLIEIIALLLRLPISRRMRVLAVRLGAVRVAIAHAARGTVAPTGRRLALIPVTLIVVAAEVGVIVAIIRVVAVVATAAAATAAAATAAASATVLILVLISITAAAAAAVMTAAASAATS